MTKLGAVAEEHLEVRYPADDELAARALQARQVRGEVHQRG